MTREERVTVEPGDVAGIVLTCGGCAARVVLVPGASSSPITPHQCPQCGQRWREQMVPFDLVAEASRVLVELANQNGRKATPYRVGLELAPDRPQEAA